MSTGTNEESGTSVEFRGLFDAHRGRQIEFWEEKEKIEYKTHLIWVATWKVARFSSSA